ncbi:MAG TPA: tetratricopeptide repeat protein [Rubricoccaceae bacterium]|jgi:tetratricopeptide (TPR) repeat protein
MAQINPPKPLSRRHALREDGLQTAVVEGEVFFEQHRTAIIAALVALAVIIAAFVGYRAYQANRSEEAQQLLGAVINEYQAGNWQTALDGAADAPGLLEIAEDYGSTPTGQQATFLAADALFQLGRTDEALAMFEAYDGEGLFHASALAGRAAIAESKGDHAGAAELYDEAAAADPTPASAPGYLLSAARAHAAAGHADPAQASLQSILDDYADAPEAQTAQIEIGRMTAAAAAVGRATGGVLPAPPRDTTAAPVPTLPPGITATPAPAAPTPAPAPAQ